MIEIGVVQTSICSPRSSACRQQPFVTLLRNRRQVGGDQRPAFAVGVTAIDLAAGGSAEDRIAVAPVFQAQGAELMLQTFREPSTQPLPVLAAVVAAVNPASGVGTFAPGRGVVLGGCDEHDIRVAWVQNETVRIDVLSPIRAGPALPATATIRADIKHGATRHKDFLGIARVDERFVNVIKMLRGAVFVAEKADGI